MRQTERQWGRRGGRKKKLNHYSQLTDRKTDGGTDSRGMRGWSGRIRHLMEREVEDDQLQCHRQKKKHLSKWILSRNTSLVLFLSVCCPPGAPQRSGYMQAKTTWIHELPFFWFRLVRLCVCNFSKLFCSGWMMCSCADLLRRLFFTPISRPHSFFFPALDSFSSAWLSQLGCLMAFKWQHLSQQTAVIWLCFKHR